MARPDDASEIQLDTPALQRRNPKKKTTIKQLFSAASKFQKNLKRYVRYTRSNCHCFRFNNTFHAKGNESDEH